MAQIRPTFGPWGEWAGPSEDFVTAPIKGAFQLLHEHQRVTNSVLQSTMYGLHQSTWANILDFILFYLMQNTLPAVILVTTPKGSPLRYLTIPYLVWAASRFIRPFAPAGCPTWCQTICVLVLVVIQSINFLLIHPLDRNDIVQIAKNPQSLVSSVLAAAKTLVQTRGVNTPWQAKNIPPHALYYSRRGMQSPERSLFLLRQSAIFFWQYLVLDIIQTITVQNSPPSHHTRPLKLEWNVSLHQWVERGTTHLAIWFIVNRLIGDSVYRLLSIVFVGLGEDSPSDWPPAFGRISEAYTLRNFWG
jgi:hypothetical protein